MGISVEVRHGDTEQKIRRQQAKKPPVMLVTTPETLQAILPGSQMRRHLKNVQCVIVDEVHDLASSKRGAQLSLALERLQRSYAAGIFRESAYPQPLETHRKSPNTSLEPAEKSA